LSAEPLPASRWRVLTTLALVLLCGSLILGLARAFVARTVDGPQRQREYFGDTPPPFALALAEAVALPSGETVVRFARAAEGAGPAQALFIEYPSRAAVEGLFRGGFSEDVGQRIKDWEREPKDAWTAMIKRDQLEWGAWSTKWIVERAFHAGGGWHEEARVDLSSKARQLVLYVHWPDQVPADEKQVLELLGALVMPQES